MTVEGAGLLDELKGYFPLEGSTIYELAPGVFVGTYNQMTVLYFRADDGKALKDIPGARQHSFVKTNTLAMHLLEASGDITARLELAAAFARQHLCDYVAELHSAPKQVYTH